MTDPFRQPLNRCPLCGERPQLQWCDSYMVLSKCGMRFAPQVIFDREGQATVDLWNKMTAGVTRPQRLDDETNP